MGYLKNMSGRERIDYIWEYYKLHIIAALVLIIFIGYTVYSQATRIDYVFNLTYTGNYMDDAKRTELENKLTKLVVKDGSKRKKALVDVLPIESGNNSAYVQKLMAEVSVGDIDIIILSKSQFDNYLKSGAFLRLDNLAGLNLKDTKYNSCLIKKNYAGNEAFGIDLSTNSVLKNMGMDVNNKIIAIMQGSGQKEKAVQVLNWILQ